MQCCVKEKDRKNKRVSNEIIGTSGRQTKVLQQALTTVEEALAFIHALEIIHALNKSIE